MLNIGRDQSDATYRYKMPRLQTKIEGRGNGIKTVVVNLVDVAKALHVEPAYPTKFFGIELGAQSKFTPKDERAVVNGSHSAGDLQKLLEKFIDVFVLCPTCKLPEIRQSIKQEKIKIDCAACGYTGVLKTAHKLATYIIKNPPEKGHSKSTESGKVDEVAIAADAAADAAKGAGDAKAGDGKDAVKKPKVEWFSDTSEAAQKARQEEEFRSMQSHAAAAAAAAVSTTETGAGGVVDAKVNEIMDKKTGAPGKLDDPVAVMKMYIASAKRKPEEIVSELKRVSTARALDDPKRLATLFSAVLNGASAATIAAQFKAQAPVLKKCAANAHDRKLFLSCFEQYVGVTEPKLAPYTPHILQVLYDTDVLTEDAIVNWAESPAESAYLVSKDVAVNVRKRAKPFVEWLKNAEEDDD